jgi:hypothetical protein
VLVQCGEEIGRVLEALHVVQHLQY